MLGKLQNYLNFLIKSIYLDRDSYEFIAYNQKKWNQHNSLDDSSPVVLVGLFSLKPSIFFYSYITNYLSNQYAARIESFHFSRLPLVSLQKVYSSFGASLGLSLSKAKPYQNDAHRITEKIFKSLKTKEDVVQIKIDKLIIGDLIYDTYLRQYFLPTVDIKDKKLKKIIFRSVLIYFACKDYLANNKVVAVIPDHATYINCGILVRLALLNKIPVYCHRHYPKFEILQLDPDLAEPFCSNHFRMTRYYKYRQLFDKFNPVEQKSNRDKASQALSQRLSGKPDAVLKGKISAYSPQKANFKSLTNSACPKILVLLHDFIDSPHIYRGMLFPDFYEWIYFLLDKAQETEFEWYVKPHPVTLIHKDQRLKSLNQLVTENLKHLHPKVKFLDASVSNKQLIEEGITSMFTVYGTAGHEFAYMGVPVVNAGDNPHISYDFNFHPKTIAEYEEYIRKADSLHIDINRSEVEEFFYMHYQYRFDNDLPKISFTYPEFQSYVDHSDSYNSRFFRYLIEKYMSEDCQIENYLESFFEFR